MAVGVPRELGAAFELLRSRFAFGRDETLPSGLRHFWVAPSLSPFVRPGFHRLSKLNLLVQHASDEDIAIKEDCTSGTPCAA